MLSRKKVEAVIETIIGKNTVIEGKITLPSSLRIDGKIIGDIDCSGDVYIGKDAHVGPKILAKNVIIAGYVEGEITAKGQVRIESTGNVEGTLVSAGLVIEEGGIFNGTSRYVSGQESLDENNPITQVTEGLVSE
jgi:Protein of unknown function, DUF583.